MAAAEPVSIPVRDGTAVPGYFTAPRRSAGSPPPLIVLPHGGPHGVRDHWDFDPEVQLLAAAGFAVLRVNYRGSGGYGAAFQAAAYGRWGELPIDDLVDAARWATGTGRADAGRVCLYGASFGGYAALRASARAPDLFRCAVGYAGVYDLALMRRSGDIQERRLGRGFLDVAVGTDESALRAASPVSAAQEIRAAVLLAHGAKDQRAPLAHAEAMRAALIAAEHPPEWLVEPAEGHGFHDPRARERFYARLLEFLVKNTAPRGP
jgi:dipeptidyl aminopeptidase/acylaminoacyl peptidase